MSNPSLELYQTHKEDINLSRRLLFSRLHKINPKIKDQIEQLYNNRKANYQLPYLGELYPWVIADLFGFEDNDKIQEVSQDWLALYYYTIFTDEVIDSNEKSFIGNEMISLTALMKEGLFKLYKAVINTPYEEEFEVAIDSVLNSGKKEESLKGKIGKNKDKVNYSEKKNDLIKLCAYALISKCVNDTDKKDKILKFTSKLQLSFQYLDDIADLKEDLKDHNYTVILNDLLKKVSIDDVKEGNLISLLIEKGVLLSFVSNIVDLFIDINYLIDSQIENSSVDYFDEISKNLSSLHLFIKQIDLNKFKTNDQYRLYTINDMEEKIEIVAMST
jgi:hypothetical protein